MRSAREYVVVAGLLLAGVFALPASASVVGANFVETQIPFVELRFNECMAEEVMATGRFHVRVYFSVSPDGKTHYSAQTSLQGVEGSTLDGARYVVQENSSDHIIHDSDLAPFNMHTEFRQHLVRLKSGGTLEKEDDFFMYIRGHLTMNANGVVTADRPTEIEIKCN
jgi:hypothetical protein